MRIFIFPWLLLLSLSAYGEDNGTAFKLRAIPEIHDANANTSFAPALPLTSLGKDRSREELEMRTDWNGVNLVATARSTAQQGVKPDKQLVINELYYDATLFGERFSLGKKILSWDVGFGFRPLDVIQQENRRSLYASTLEGVPYLSWEKFTADEAWMLVLANPGRGMAGEPRDDESLALKYFRRFGNTDAHALLRVSRRYSFEAGASFSSVADDGLEWHGSLLHQARYQKSLNTLTLNSGIPLSASDPFVTQNFRHGRKALLGATLTGESGLSLLGEAWYDNSAYTAAEWRAAADLARRQEALLGQAGIPAAAVRGSLAYGTRYFERPNLLKKNLLLRLSHRSEVESWEPAIDVLYTPEDGGRVVSASLAYEANRYRIDAGLRLYGGRADSAYRLLPEKRVVYLAIQLAF
ncbi:MAG: hypothetical protein NT159_04690 [Proteobacteria bacterium]|nr:hypothetical protein [Pseudomonadota bacterium]